MKYILIFINCKIKEKYDNEPHYYLKKISKINYEDNSVEFNIIFLYTNLETIFSVEISDKYKRYDKNNNIILIQKLLTDENEERKEYFEKLFKLTFLDCLKHFRGSDISPLLDGMTNFIEHKIKYENDQDYLNNLDSIVMNYEELQKKRIPRKKKTKEKEDI